MVMKKNIISKIIIAVVVVILCIPIIIDVVANSSLKSIKFEDYKSTLESTSNYGFALLYVADSNEEDTKETKKEIKTMMDAYIDNGVGTSVKSYYLDSKDLRKDDLKEVFGSSDIKSGYVFMLNNEIIRVEDKSISDKRLSDLASEYSMNGISKEVTYYKVAKDAEAYKKLVKDKKTVTMAVFGRDNCFYCNQFKAVYNTVAEQKELDIYYFDSLTYDEEEYQSIMDLGLTVPASCSDDDKEFKLESGFSTPLTLFTKNGKVIDCISGYINKEKLITKLETLGMIEE